MSKGAATGHARWVGLDVEPLPGRSLDALGGEILSPVERRRPIAPDAAGLLRTWVRKEAVLKALGTGLATPMTSFAVSAPEEAASVLTGPAVGQHLIDLGGPPGVLAAVCVVGPAATPVEHDARPLYAAWVGDPERSSRSWTP